MTAVNGGARSNGFEASADPAAIAPEDLDWEKYTKFTESAAGQVTYICEFRGKCGYKSTKQSVKRHVLSTHLRFRPHQCHYCEKDFPAVIRAALMSHIATHTGELPLKCKYEGCVKRYADPARRHRHYISAHGYKPKEYKKKFRAPRGRNDIGDPDDEAPESEQDNELETQDSEG
ncbi:hypothetical protein H0H87_009041 [Tephrocybe sp. NHM501043]|nr:hypothetical protein H0H87_009041 [Tephrocybe sp. NHM501043]